MYLCDAAATLALAKTLSVMTFFSVYRPRDPRHEGEDAPLVALARGCGDGSALAGFLQWRHPEGSKSLELGIDGG